jgi:hypothetical protein
MLRKHRHPIRGIFGGLLLGLGLAVASVVYSINSAGPMTPWIAFIIGLVVGIALIFIPSIRKGRRSRPQFAPGPPPR